MNSLRSFPVQFAVSAIVTALSVISTATTQAGFSVVQTFGSLGTGSGKFSQPIGMALDGFGNIYVADRANRRVLRYNVSGEYTQRLDVEANADGLTLLDPVSVAVDDSLAYIADRGRAQIIRYKRRP